MLNVHIRIVTNIAIEEPHLHYKKVKLYFSMCIMHIYLHIRICEYNTLKMIWKKTGYSGYFWEEKRNKGRKEG